MKHYFLLAALLISALTRAEANITGTILTNTDSPVANAVVSDGFSVVTTNADGTYSMPFNDSALYVFVSVPSGYDFPKDSTGTAQIWQALDKSADSHVHNFVLTKQADGGQADSSHVLIVFGDPQVLDDYCLWRFRNETLADVQQLQASYPVGTKFVGLTVGDIVWDTYSLFPAQKASYEMLDFPNFFVIGNHDHKSNTVQPDTAKTDSAAAVNFEQYFGPTYYSFNMGAIHYVILDNVYYNAQGSAHKGYKCELTPQQKTWITKDLEHIHEGTQVIFSFHINAANNGKDLRFLQNLVTKLNCTNYIISGHVHKNSVTVHEKNFIEHNIGAAQGSFWCSDWCGDGAPNGYKVFETSPLGISNWYYKGTGHDIDFRIKTFPINSINAGNTKQDKVLANVWDFDKGGKVRIWENGVEYEMNKFKGTDPDVYDVMLDESDTRPNYPGSEGGTDAGKNPGAETTDHMFYYKPKDVNADLTVVYTDRFGKETSAQILRHMMVASFKQSGELWEYTQDFNTLPSYPNFIETETPLKRGTWIAGHTPCGWYGSTSKKVMPSEGTATWGGYNHIYIDNGSESKGWLYSYGQMDATDSDKNGRERALGSMNTSQQKRISYGVLLENNTGGVITSLDISYTGEVWRMGTNTNDKLQFSYAILTDEQATQIRDRKAWIGEIASTNADSLNFATPTTISSASNTAIDGNDTNNRKEVNGKIELEVQPGQVIMLRWDDDLCTEDSDQAFAIDDVVIKATSEEITGLNRITSSIVNRHNARSILYNGQVLIQTEKSMYTLSGQKK